MQITLSDQEMRGFYYDIFRYQNTGRDDVNLFFSELQGPNLLFSPTAIAHLIGRKSGHKITRFTNKMI